MKCKICKNEVSRPTKGEEKYQQCFLCGEKAHPTKTQVKIGTCVQIIYIDFQNKENEIIGKVQQIVTRGNWHYEGLMVILDSGHKGRVKKIIEEEEHPRDEDSKKMHKKAMDVLKEIDIASGGSISLPKSEKPKIPMNKWPKIEDVRTEFKSSWQFDIKFDEIKKRGKPEAIDEYKKRHQGMEKRLKEEVVETVCSFLNTEGGSILLGVSDSGEAIGLEKDLARFSKPDKNPQDVLRRSITASIEYHIRAMTSEISFKEHEIDSKYILEIKVRSLRENEDPAFMKINDKKKILIVREMDADVKYYDGEKQLQYVRKRFPSYLQ